MKTQYVDSKERFASYKIGNILFDLINFIDKDYSKIAIVCIGTDTSTGDSFGPLVGHQLMKYKGMYDFELYGSLEEPVHALNLEQIISRIEEENTLIISIDACLGRYDSIGKIQIGLGGIKPGSGVGKDLPRVGDIFINGIVNMSGLIPQFTINSTRLNTVYKLMEITSLGIRSAFLKLNDDAVRVEFGNKVIC